MASNPQPFLQAARRYGSDPKFNAWAQKTYGVSGPVLLAKVAKGESNFNMGAVSSAGAKGGTQFMPGTRQDFISRYGVDPWKDPDSAIHATKLYLENDSRGLAGYNPGMPTYTDYILGQHVGSISGGGSPGKVRGSSSTTTTTPGVDNSAQRRQIVANYLAEGGVRNSAATLDFASGYQAAQDVPAQTTTTYSNRSGSSGSTYSGGSGISPRAKPGDPVVSTKQSEGGLHQTDGLPGYPAHDYFAPAGTHAVAPVSGRVIKLSGHDPASGPTNGPHGPLGWSVYIQGDDGKTYFLTHMGSRNVKVGQKVRQGQIIGTVADYDKYGTPSHIHQGVNG